MSSEIETETKTNYITLSSLTPYYEGGKVKIQNHFGVEVDESILEKYNLQIEPGLYTIVDENGNYVDENGKITDYSGSMTVCCRELYDKIGDDF